MSCHSMGGGGSRKVKIAMISGAGAGAAGIAYVSLAANPAASAALPALLAFSACPAMCGAMGGAMWLSRRFKKRNNALLGQTVKDDNRNIDQEKLAIGQHPKVNENSLLDDNGKEIVQVQSNKRKLKERRLDSDNDSVSTSAS